MTFISYAQNYEDVMLWRALKHIEKGFYIDVGANDPIVDSVTHSFYNLGWSGINIEPLEKHFKDLTEQRQRDINLKCAIGSEMGEMLLWECDIRGWATASPNVIEQHIANGHQGVFHTIPVHTLKDICSKYIQSDVHFLKIDIEGFEKQAIEGMDFQLCRPWIIIIEATKPNTVQENHVEWEYILIHNDYFFVYADGLNRFYLANEHKELEKNFKYPPNVFDNFKKVELVLLENKVEQAEAKIQQAEAKIQQAEAKIQQAEAKIQQAEAKIFQYEKQLQDLHQSNSWRVTAFLRYFSEKFHLK